MKNLITLGLVTTVVYLFLPKEKRKEIKEEVKCLFELMGELTSVGTYKGHPLYQGPNGGVYYWSWGRKVYLRRRRHYEEWF